MTEAKPSARQLKTLEMDVVDEQGELTIVLGAIEPLELRQGEAFLKLARSAWSELGHQADSWQQLRTHGYLARMLASH